MNLNNMEGAMICSIVQEVILSSRARVSIYKRSAGPFEWCRLATGKILLEFFNKV